MAKYWYQIKAEPPPGNPQAAAATMAAWYADLARPKGRAGPIGVEPGAAPANTPASLSPACGPWYADLQPPLKQRRFVADSQIAPASTLASLPPGFGPWYADFLRARAQ